MYVKYVDMYCVVLFGNCMLIDMIVQMMHGYYAWFKMLEAKLCVLMV